MAVGADAADPSGEVSAYHVAPKYRVNRVRCVPGVERKGRTVSRGHCAYSSGNHAGGAVH